MLLVLSGHYDRDPGLDNYLLALLDKKEGQINQWLCTSSHVNGQQRGDQHSWGGLIPPAHHCRNLPMWKVHTTPEDSRHVKGVEGNFYRISPYEVITMRGTKRSALGIHRDAGVPGSLGCIVMNSFNWNDFESTMAMIHSDYGIEKLPLFPLYS